MNSDRILMVSFPTICDENYRNGTINRNGIIPIGILFIRFEFIHHESKYEHLETFFLI